MSKMEQYAKRWKLIVDRLGIKPKYISDQTGLTTAEVNAFFEIADEIGIDERFDNNKIHETLKQFFASELTVGNFKYIDDDVFSAILSDLQDEFHLSANEMQGLIRDRIDKDYSEQQKEKDAEVAVGFLDYQINKHGIDHIIDTPELLEAKRQKRKELRAERDKIDDLLTYGISFAVDIDSETGEYIEEEYSFSPQEISDMNKQRSKLQTEIEQLETEIEQLETEISQLLHQNEQDWKEYSTLLRGNTSSDDSTFSEELRKNKSKSRTQRKEILKKGYAFNAVQQKAILELFFDLCTDQDGYVLPDHFGSGVSLARMIEEKIIWTGGWNNLRGIQKVTYWTTYDESFEYDYNVPINIIESSDPVYRLIQDHPQVFFHDPSTEKVKSFMMMLRDEPQDVKNKLFHKLVEESAPIMSRTAEARGYCGILSEYYDILSLQIPVANFKYYSREDIYRIVYEIAAASNGSIKFSNELVQSVYLRIHFKANHWQLQMYLSQYYFHHKEFDSLVEFIEREAKETEI